jgi:hypothetical protein
MYDLLVTHGSTDDAATQELLITEWAILQCESHSTPSKAALALGPSSQTRRQQKTSSTA